MKKTILLLSLIGPLLAACDPLSKRDCGLFDHPDLAAWQTDTTEQTVSFMNSEGSMMNFTRQAVVFNEPFLGTDGASNDEDVVCELQARVRLQASDNSLAMTSIYTQEEKFLLDSADEVLLIDHDLEAPVGRLLTGRFVADISIDQPRLTSDPLRVIYLEEDQSSLEIGGQAYEDVVRINAPGGSPESADDAIDHVQQIVIAREFGIVAFTDAQGREFTRLPAQ